MKTPNEYPRIDDMRESQYDAIAAHYRNEARAALMAHEAAQKELDRIEARLLTARTPAHVNPHD